LQLLTGTGSETHFEVREPFIPCANDAHLLRAIFGAKLRWMKILEAIFPPKIHL
jgi:hypothetical protein